MIVNTYAVLALLLASLEALLGAIVVVGAVRAARASRGEAGRGPSDAATSGLFLASVALLGLAVVSWPLLYLLLDSYASQWQGVMCIEGVARIGSHAGGVASLLPFLAHGLEATKPLVLLAAGAWLLLHLANRRTRTAPLSGRVVAVLGVAAALAIVDAATQAAYVLIPKDAPALARGCCTASEGGGAALLDSVHPDATALTVLFVASAVLMAAWAWRAARATGGFVASRSGTVVLLLACAPALALGLAFLREVASPAFLGRPGHHCVYCMLASTPLGGLALGLLALGAFAVAWACLLRRLGDDGETRPFVPARVASLLLWGSFGWLGAVVLTSVQLATA